VREKARKQYLKALVAADKLGPQEIARFVLDFDLVCGNEPVSDTAPIRSALARMQETASASKEGFEAALKLCDRLGDQVSRRRIQQQRCLGLARAGDADGLLAMLIKRQQNDSITKEELHAALQTFLRQRSFETGFPWNQFFSKLPEELIPSLHQVYAVMGRMNEAAALAEAAGDLRNALSYLMSLVGKRVALQALTIAERLGDAEATIAAHAKVAESMWTENDYAAAIIHFEKSNLLERASDCQQRLGDLAAAIQLRPTINPDWLHKLRGEAETKARALHEKGQFIEAARLLRNFADASRAKSGEQILQSEADRMERLLAEVVKTGRAAMQVEVRATQAEPNADVFRRWSHLEEAAGNFLEAALQAELAQDYLSASLLFEKAGAFGQALSALGKTKQVIDPKRRAELLQGGGDYFMAALLYQHMGEIDKAVNMFEEGQEFARAANLRRTQIGDKQCAFDDRYLNLLTKAGRVESLAEVCYALANVPNCSADERAQLFRRIKHLTDRDLVGPKWRDLVADELPKVEAADKKRFLEGAGDWLAAVTKEMLDTYLDAFGMDLGTSNSVLALFNRKMRQPEVVSCRGRQTIPSVFAIDQAGREIIGLPESEFMGKSPRTIVTCAKRAMGTNKQFQADGQMLRAEEISARILTYAHMQAQNHLRHKIADGISVLAAQAMGTPPQNDWVESYLDEHPPTIALGKAVITVPAYFNEAQKEATRNAAVLARLSILRLMHEPTAACLAQRTGRSKEESLLVIDLGAGTLDLSLLQIGDGVIEVVEIEGDNTLGSADLDEVLYAHFTKVVQAQTGQEFGGNSLAGKRLRQACEEMKIELSTHNTWTVTLPHLVGTKSVELVMQRDELERLAAPWLMRVRDVCRKIKNRPGRVLLIGGGALMPAVRSCVKEIFGMDPSPGLDPLTAVARGAAIQAAILAGVLSDVLVLDAVPFSLGIKSHVAPGEFKFDPLIHKHATIPAEATGLYTTVEDDQAVVRIEIFQGEDPQPDKNYKIGQFRLEGILPAKAGTPKIEVTFKIDANCLLRVSARDQGTNRECHITIADSHLLSPAQMSSLGQRLREAETRQDRLKHIEELTVTMTALLQEIKVAELPSLQDRFPALLKQYELHMARYSPTPADNKVMLEIYRDRNEAESKTRLALDRWDTLRKSAQAWLNRCASMGSQQQTSEQQLEIQLDEGQSLSQRLSDGAQAIRSASGTYRRWIAALEGLPLNSTGDAVELAEHFLRLARHEEAWTHFRRLGPPTTRRQVTLGLEILARLRQRQEYEELFRQYSNLLAIAAPDLIHMNRSVRIYGPSVVWIQQQSGTGSGFAIGSKMVATNRHVVIDDATGKPVKPEWIRVIGKKGTYRVASISVPSNGHDDVAILQLSEETKLLPLRLGFSELVEVGERIMTLGFPSPGSGGFEENLYCNAGLVNRIRPSEFCSERVLEVSLELQGGISGAPILNELGEVIGLVTYTLIRARPLEDGQVHHERLFYAIPVQVLRRLRAQVYVAGT
jgi:molecular chaperone DnaK